MNTSPFAGREGQFVLVNGARRPRIVVARDERWRVWNASNGRYLKLTLGDGRSFAHVGTDGGLLERPREGVTARIGNHHTTTASPLI